MLWLAVSAALLTRRCSAADVVSTYIGADNGNWNLASNWSNVPGVPYFPSNGNGSHTYDAVVSAASVNLSSSVTLSSLTLNGGSIGRTNASNYVDVQGSFAWNAGNLQANVSTWGFSINGGGAKALTSTLTLGQLPPLHFSASWNGGDIIGGTGTIENDNGSFDIRCDNNFSGAFLNGAVGQTTKSAGTGVTTINGTFSNYGTVSVNVGTLSLVGGGAFYKGSLDGAPGSTVRVNGSLYFQSPSRVNLSSLIIDGGQPRFDSNTTVSDLTMNGGSVFITNMTVDKLTLNGGTFTSIVQLNPSTIDWNGNASISADLFTNTLNITGQGNGTRNLGGSLHATQTIFDAPATINIGGKFSVPTGGTFSLTGSGQLTGVGLFANAGALTKTSASDVTWSVPVTNDGSIDVQAGTLRFTRDFYQTGSLTVARDAAVAFGYTGTLQPSSSVDASTIIMQGNQYLSVNGAFNVGRELRLLAGQVTCVAGSTPDFTGATINFPTNVSNAVLNLKSGKNVSAGSLVLNSSATLINSDPLTVSDSLQWNGGTISGSGTVTVPGSALISNLGPTRSLAETQALIFGGLATMSGTVILDRGAVLTVAPTSTLTVTRNVSVAGGTFHNAGIIKQIAGSGTTTISGLFNNSGTVVVSAGTLAMTGGGMHSGRFVGDVPATTFQFSGPHSFTAGSKIDAFTVLFSGTNAIDVAGSYLATATTVNRTPLQLHGPLSFSAGAPLALTNGASLDLGSDAGSPSALDLALSVTNSTATLRTTNHLASVSVAGTGATSLSLARPAGSPPVVLYTRGYSLSGQAASLQLGDNALVVDYSASPSGSPLAQIRSQIISGYGAANATHFATAPGILSTAASNNTGGAIGYAEASDVLNLIDGQASFLGETVGSHAVLARYTLAGDANLDGVVDFSDLVALAQNYGAMVWATGEDWWPRGDFNYDGTVDFNDLVKLAQNYNATLPTQPIAGAPATFESDLARALASVPEPATLMLPALAAACGFALPHRRRNRSAPPRDRGI